MAESSFSFAEADRQIREVARLEAGRGARNMVLGWYAARMKAADQWQKYGYADEAAYRDAVGVSNGVWSRYTRIAGALPEVGLDEFCAMTAENAEMLGRLPQEVREQGAWLENAKTMQAEEFHREVLRERAELAGVPVKEMRVKFALPLFEGQRRVIREGLAEFMKDHAIQDEGTALEWMVMEVSGRRTFARFLQQQLPVLKTALRPGGDARRAVEEHLLAVQGMLENLKDKA